MPACVGLLEEHLDPAAVPTTDQLAAKIRKMRRGKAPGLDGLPTEIFKAAPSPWFSMLQPSPPHHQDSTSCQGARSLARWTPYTTAQGPISKPTGYRSIFASNFATKLYHSVLQDHLVDVWHRDISHLQYGGRQGCSSDTPHLLVSTAAFRFCTCSQEAVGGFVCGFQIRVLYSDSSRPIL